MFILPLSKAVIAVISLFYAVGHWNSYFSAVMYLNDRAKYPLSMILREILVQNMVSGNDFASIDMSVEKVYLTEILKYSLIVVSSLPIIALYPFIQRYFIKGIMIGSIKG
jgi:multiple sugar transport system permease protein/putative aldouronate transport system permease protein